MSPYFIIMIVHKGKEKLVFNQYVGVKENIL